MSNNYLDVVNYLFSLDKGISLCSNILTAWGSISIGPRNGSVSGILTLLTVGEATGESTGAAVAESTVAKVVALVMWVLFTLELSGAEVVVSQPE